MKLVFYFYCIFICLAISAWQCLLKPSQEILANWGLSQLISYQVPSSTWLVWTGKYPEIYSPPVRKQHGYFLHITDMHVRNPKKRAIVVIKLIKFNLSI